SLPVEGLRGRLQVLDEHNERLDRNLGRAKDPLLATASSPDQAIRHVQDALRGWLAIDLQAENNSEAVLIERLQQLARDGNAATAEWRTPDVFAWEAALNGTALMGRGNPNGYADLADYVARCLQGKEVFPGLRELRRIASPELTQNQAELMTLPV